MLSVRMLGGLTFCEQGRRLGLDLGDNGRLLAAYLFEFPGRIHRRDRLATMFWDELEPERARTALNTALWRLRKLLAATGDEEGASLYSAGQDVALEPAASIIVDTYCFDNAARTVLAAQGSICAARACALEEAVETYSGSFLEGNDSDWIIAERERLHTLFVRCLNELVKLHVTSGCYELAISAARRILAVDPFRESVQRSLALLLTLNGQRAQALLELRRWGRELRREMGIGPMAETHQLETSIISGIAPSDLTELKRSYFQAPT